MSVKCNMQTIYPCQAIKRSDAQSPNSFLQLVSPNDNDVTNQNNAIWQTLSHKPLLQFPPTGALLRRKCWTGILDPIMTWIARFGEEDLNLYRIYLKSDIEFAGLFAEERKIVQWRIRKCFRKLILSAILNSETREM